MQKQAREKIVNGVMIALVVLSVVGFGYTVEKNLMDKEARERKEALDKKATHFEDFIVLTPLQDPDAMQKEGFIFSKSKMYQTDGAGVKPLIQNVMLPNKTKVMISGRIILPNGSSRVLDENEMITMNGDVVVNTHSLELTTPESTPSAAITAAAAR